MTKLKPSKQVKPLLDEARSAHLSVTSRGNTWVIEAPGSSLKPVFIPFGAKLPRNLANKRAEIRRLAETLTPAPTPTPAQEPAMPAGWTIRDLIAHARAEGVDLRVSGKELFITTPPGAESIAAALTHHTRAVIAALVQELTPEPADAEPADVEDHAEPAADEFLDDARAVWACMRDEAREQGEKTDALDGTPGVLWEGSRDTTIRALGSDWPRERLAAIRIFLASCGAMACVRRGCRPLWWLRAEWPTEAARALRVSQIRQGPKPTPAEPVEETPAEPVESSDPLQALARIRDRITAAEQQAEAEATRADLAEDRAEKAEQLAKKHAARADTAETRVTELETENRDLTARLDTVAPKLAELNQIKHAFRDLAAPRAV
ncbi:hypothetical protein ACFY19_20870 [Streptosporangium saharense]|uniref:hypothetical protein n=1 Tax=Streptosporangium saharense TaxID=1706840 RepID=UPI00368A3440